MMVRRISRITNHHWLLAERKDRPFSGKVARVYIAEVAKTFGLAKLACRNRNSWRIPLRELRNPTACSFQSLVVCLGLWLCCFVGVSSYCRAQEFDRAALQTELARLEQICHSLQLNSQATFTRQWLATQRTDLSVLYLPGVTAEFDATNPQQKNWSAAFQAARNRYAATLFSEAKRHASEGDEAASFRLLWQVLREDPEHAEAKRILGTMASAATVKPRLRKGQTPHPEFGWPAGSYSRIETPHFLLTTRGEPRQSVELAQLMERYYALWRQVFYPLWATPGMLANKFEGRNTPWEKAREMQVVLLRDRQDYLQVLGVTEQNAAVSVGYYAPQKKMSFFFAAPDYEVTLFHELTHQLFAEATNIDARPDAGSLGGVWLTEGIALYMESLVNRGTYWTLGGIDAPRLQTARYRAVRDGFWAAWESFTKGHVEDWKQDPKIALLYTQACGLTHLYMDQLSQPSAREALLRALVGVYQNQLNFDELRLMLGSEDEARKLAYQQALTLTDDDVRALCDAGLTSPSLVLAGSQLSPEYWQELKCLAAGLTWLDVSFSNAKSSDLAWVSSADMLERLSLEGTACDGEILKQVAKLARLKELDLTGCAIDDDSLEAMAGHSQLETLWLSKTQVSDAAIETLGKLPRLKFCEIEGTNISPGVWERFSQSKSLGK
jgi:hypothetical protein